MKAHLSFSFGLFRLGLAAGNLRLMFGQFTIQVRNYITALASPSFTLPPSSRRVGDYAVCPILVSVWRRKVMSDAVQLPMTPLPRIPPRRSPPLSFTLPRPSGTCTVTDEEECQERRDTLKDTAKSDCGTSQFVIIVRFKCFCKNVVNLPTLLEAWVPWAGTNIQHIQYVFSCKFNVY